MAERVALHNACRAAWDVGSVDLIRHSPCYNMREENASVICTAFILYLPSSFYFCWCWRLARGGFESSEPNENGDDDENGIGADVPRGIETDATDSILCLILVWSKCERELGASTMMTSHARVFISIAIVCAVKVTIIKWRRTRSKQQLKQKLWTFPIICNF